MLTLANVEVVYSDVVVGLRGISLTVAPGAIVALLGANGAGKTTCLRAISGLLDVHRGKITKGTITFDGERIDRCDATEIVRRGVAQVLEGRRIFPELTVDENLRAGSFGQRDGGRTRRPYDRVMTLFPALAERRGSIAGYLSGGEQQMLAIGRALMA
ncbi:MAG: ATP-binding cassette domain-containing protein, partial [Chloroflexi bacterium]